MSVGSVQNTSANSEMQPHSSSVLSKGPLKIVQDTISPATNCEDSYASIIMSYFYSCWKYITGIFSSSVSGLAKIVTSAESPNWDGVILGSFTQTSALQRGSMFASSNIGKFSCTMIDCHAVRMFLEDRMHTSSDVDLAVMKGMASTLIRLGFRDRLPKDIFAINNPLELHSVLQSVVDKLDGTDISLIDGAFARYNQAGGPKALQSFDEITGGNLFPENYLELTFPSDFEADCGLSIPLSFLRHEPVNYKLRTQEVQRCLDSFIRKYPGERIAGGIVAPPFSMAICFNRDEKGEIVSAHLFDSHGYAPHSRAFLMSWDKTDGDPVVACANFLSRLSCLNTEIIGITPLKIP